MFNKFLFQTDNCFTPISIDKIFSYINLYRNEFDFLYLNNGNI